MKRALVKLGPIATTATLSREVNLDTTPRLYDRAQLWPQAFVDVDHDKTEIGRVLNVHRFDDTDGLWLAAVIEVDAPPAWLKRGTPVSLTANTTFRRERNGWPVHDVLVRGISLVSAAAEAAQLGARVCTLRDVETAPAPAPTRVGADTPELRELWRRVDAGELIEDVIAEIAARGRGPRARTGYIVRDFGRVLAVR